MAKIEKFEDIKAWQFARDIVNSIYEITKKEKFRKDFGLRNQIQRASVSIMSNIAEGFARRSNKEFIQFLYIAHGSVAEVQSQLYVSLDLNYVNQKEFELMYSNCMECSKTIMGFIKYLKS